VLADLLRFNSLHVSGLKKYPGLLKNTCRPVHEIGRQCGLVNENSFTRLFREEFKITLLRHGKK
jgi:transcriptional regulator GlxA family with amidase domain